MLEAKLPKRGNKLKKLKSFDPATLPPCKNVLDQKINRSNYIAYMYKNSHKRKLVLWDPLAHGYVIENDMLQPLWFTGDRVPDELYLPDEEDDDDDDDDDEDDDKENRESSDDDTDSDDEN